MGFFRKIRGMLHLQRHDWIALVLSFVLATAVWMIHNLSLKYTVMLSVPVLAQCEGLDGFDSQSIESERVVARFRATGFDILQVKKYSNTNPCRVRFFPEDLHLHSSGSFYIVSRDLIDYTHDIFGESAVMDYFARDTVFFRFSPRKYKKVPVVLESSVSLDPQYQFEGPIAIEPDSILVYADPLRLEHIDAVHTDLVREPSLASSKDGMVKLRAMSGVRFSQNQVKYAIRIRRCVEQEFCLKVALENVPDGHHPVMSIDKVKVVANCLFPLPQGVEKDLQFYVDARDAYESGGAAARIRLKNQPAWLLSYRIEPQVITLSE
ncbi:MAG: hypothetical protein K5651_05520 [Bacteroidales bacterium]|nr:hypothetical protein [Bacteroidales bacterium]